MPNDSDIGTRRIGRPPREIPPAIATLAQRAYERGAVIVVQAPPNITTEDVDKFRLDMRAAGKRLGEHVHVTVTGITADDRHIYVDKRRDMDRWPTIVKLAVKVYTAQKGAIR